MTTRDLAKLGLALLLGAAIAFPAGMMVAGWGGGGAAPAPAAPPSDAAGPNMFSPSVRSDPWFLARQREGVEALERHCARTGEMCAEAHAARERLTEISSPAGS